MFQKEKLSRLVRSLGDIYEVNDTKIAKKYTQVQKDEAYKKLIYWNIIKQILQILKLHDSHCSCHSVFIIFKLKSYCLKTFKES